LAARKTRKKWQQFIETFANKRNYNTQGKKQTLHSSKELESQSLV